MKKLTSKEVNEYIKEHGKKLTDRQIAEKTGISISIIKNRRYKMGMYAPRKEYPVENRKKAKKLVEEDLKVSRLSGQKKVTDKKYREALKEIDRLEAELRASLGIKSGVRPVPIKPNFGSGTSEATAVVVASDWHVAEEVRPEKVNFRNKYNLDISRKRAEEFFQKTARLVKKEQQDTKIDNLVLALLGDFISGNIHEELLENCLLQPIEETIFAENLIAGGIEFLLANTKLNLTIPCHVGNHGRITKKVHISTEQGNSLEYYMYRHLENRFKKEARVKFIVAEGYHTYLPIYGFVLRLHHGHAIGYGGGVGGPTIPILKAVKEWSDRENYADFDTFGHLHQYLPHPLFTMNGSMIGYSPFAIRCKARFEPPRQAFFLIDKKRGKTVHMPIMFSV